MVRVSVEYFGHVRSIFGNRQRDEIALKSSANVLDLLCALLERYGEKFSKAIYDPSAPDVKANYMVTVNGVLLNQAEGVKTKLKEGDRVAILPVVSGG